ncbi:hypothetical protein OESDEN_10183 [Oesophagostomum dentatum]|uniref:Uncharacterized protein n=1 Tax=Oesophagostomum dentatum TaxID=61180 RepID=A0A0B1T1F3_OESDE|nr:hypothetical protein OESDEN_10183 [Oesophagostomum dentatum]
MKPYIVNNNFYVGVKNKEARQAINDLWFLSKSGHCAPTKVQRAREKFHAEDV